MFKVYWTDEDKMSRGDEREKLTEALALCEKLRKQGYRFVTMVSEDPNSVGKPGVDSVVDGKCPDGIEYDWKKRRV